VLFNSGEDTLQDDAFSVHDYHALKSQAGIWRSTILSGTLYTEATVHHHVPSTISHHTQSLLFNEWEYFREFLFVWKRRREQKSYSL